MYGEHMWGMGGFGGVGLLLTLVLVGLGVYYLVRALEQRPREGTSTGASDRALEILRERYARGEIDEAEFEAKKQRLS